MIELKLKKQLTANRISVVKEYYFSKKLREIDQLNQQGKNIINLGIGSPDLAPDQRIVNALITSAQNPNNHAYQSYKGIPELRAAIANWSTKIYGVNLRPETEILPLMGSKEGIMHISMTYLNEGDEVLIPNPGYPTYAAATNLAGGKVVKYNLKEENNWQPNLTELRALISENTKLIWMNFPNMPTGAPADLQILSDLIQLAKANDILLINDNPYSLTLNENPTSIFQIEGAKEMALELNSLSKSHSMAGWRIGWISGKQDRIAEILKFKSNMDSGMFLPIQHAAICALNLEKSDLENTNKMYAKRRKLVWKMMDILGCSYKKSQVGMFVWAKIPSQQIDATAFSDLILNHVNVFITPGIIFGDAGKQYIRISLCCTSKKLIEAMNRIKNFMI